MTRTTSVPMPPPPRRPIGIGIPPPPPPSPPKPPPEPRRSSMSALRLPGFHFIRGHSIPAPARRETARMSERTLPDPIARHLKKVLPEGASTPARIRLTQTGEMVQKPGGRRLPFKAVEELSVRTIEFEWRAVF